jgi:hypothetical protein
MNQPTDQQIIEQVLNQAVKSGVFGNLDSVAAVWRAWGTIKYKLEQLEQDGKAPGDNN